MDALAANTDRPRAYAVLFRRAAAFCAMLAVAMVFRAEHLTDWDSWDYAAQAIQRHSSDLLLGRWWFIAAMRTAYLAGRAAFGLDALSGYLAMQAACAIVMAAAVVAGMAWTWRLTRSAAAETIFAVLMICGPMIGIYASAVMTEGATLCALTLAFWLWERAIGGSPRAVWWALAGGVCFGIVVDIREQAFSFCAWPVISCLIDRPARRWRLLAVAAAAAAGTLLAGVLAAWAWYPWVLPDATRTIAGVAVDVSYFHNIHLWAGWMSRERSLFGVAIPANLKYLATYAAAAAPVAALLAIPAVVWARRKRRRLFWLAVATTPYLLTLLINHDLSVNPRFAIPAVWMLAPVVAAAGAAWVASAGRYRPRLAAVLCGIVLATVAAVAVGWDELDRRYFRYVEGMGRACRSMLRLDAEAVIVAGPATPVAHYLNRLGVKRFETIASGWDWPGERLAGRIQRRLADGRAVYVNLDAPSWQCCARDSGELQALQKVAAGYDLRPAGWPMVRLVRRAGNP